jgi:hypothetical protein
MLNHSNENNFKDCNLCGIVLVAVNSQAVNKNLLFYVVSMT